MKNKTPNVYRTKNKLLGTCLVLISTHLCLGCLVPVKESKKNNTPASSLTLHVANEKYILIDAKKSTVTWKGSSLNGLNSQTGYVSLSKGELMIEGGQLVSGTIEVDMNTVEDKNHESANKLVHHLKDSDFFDVEKFPFSTIVITNVTSLKNENKKITGNLTIKGITHQVKFPAKIEINGEVIRAKGKLVIDRTLWNVRYKSAKFYQNLANQTMSDSIEFNFNVVAKNNSSISI